MIIGYRILQRIESDPVRIIVEVAFDGDGYCYGVDEAGTFLWRPTDTWSVNLPEGAVEDDEIKAHITQWESESRLPTPQSPGDWIIL